MLRRVMSTIYPEFIKGSFLVAFFFLWLGVSSGISALYKTIYYLIPLALVFSVLLTLLYILYKVKIQTVCVPLGALSASFIIWTKRVFYIFNGTMITSLLVSLIVTGGFPSKIHLPTFDATEARVGLATASVFILLLLWDILFAFGFPPGIDLFQKTAIKKRINIVSSSTIFSVYIFAYFAALFQLSFFVVLIFIIYFITFVIFYCFFETYRISSSAFNFATIARGTPLYKSKEFASYIHLTDIHLTSPGLSRVDGGKSGNNGLLKYVTNLDINLPKFVFITGDITDRGDAEEWKEALEILMPLKEKGVRIILTPGNHDLATAYNVTDATFSINLTHFRGGKIRGMNGLRLRTFLDVLATLEPNLQNAQGETIRSTLERENKNIHRLWNLVEETRLKISSNIAKKEAMIQLRIEAEKLFPGYPPSGGWEMLIYISSEAFQDLYISSLYAERWYDYFPLHMMDNKTRTQIIILNSIAPDPTLLKSAWGDFGEKQIDRLIKIIRTRKAQNLFILSHHPIFRWYDECSPSFFSLKEIRRWACLSTSALSTNRLIEILNRSQHNGRLVFFFCGHRHGSKHTDARIGVCDGVKVAEGASLTDENAAILAVWRGSGDKLYLGKL